MKTVKKYLPEGVKKMYTTKIGRKVKVVNKLYVGKKKKASN
jgi:hypothetical protein